MRFCDFSLQRPSAELSIFYASLRSFRFLRFLLLAGRNDSSPIDV